MLVCWYVCILVFVFVCLYGPLVRLLKGNWLTSFTNKLTTNLKRRAIQYVMALTSFLKKANPNLCNIYSRFYIPPPPPPLVPNRKTISVQKRIITFRWIIIYAFNVLQLFFMIFLFYFYIKNEGWFKGRGGGQTYILQNSRCLLCDPNFCELEDDLRTFNRHFTKKSRFFD